jgi:Tfp pilus assembly protein PilZ
VDDLVSGPLHDISEGGLFIKTKAQRPVGTPISIRIAVPAEQVSLELQGKIVRTVSIEEARRNGQPAGLAVMFTSLSDSTRNTLQRLVQAALAAQAARG